MSQKKLISVIKWVWIAVVVFGAGYYFYRNYITIADYLSSLRIIRLTGSLLFLLLGKILLSDITRLSAKKVGLNLSYKDALSITSVTQLGKYLPGGIWHIAGKFGVYKASGISVRKATWAMVWENGLLLSTAGSMGAFILLLSGEELVCRFLSFICINNLQQKIIIAIPILWILFNILLEKVLYKEIDVREFLLAAGEQILLWLLFGLSLWMVFPPETALIPQIIGAFSFSWAVGYVAVFAPGGIGIRELLLTMILGSVFSSQEVSAYATVHRLLWVLIEIILGASTAILFGIPAAEKKNDK